MFLIYFPMFPGWIKLCVYRSAAVSRFLIFRVGGCWVFITCNLVAGWKAWSRSDLIRDDSWLLFDLDLRAVLPGTSTLADNFNCTNLGRWSVVMFLNRMKLRGNCGTVFGYLFYRMSIFGDIKWLRIKRASEVGWMEILSLLNCENNSQESTEDLFLGQI